MPNKKKPQQPIEPDVTPYNIETILKRATIIIKAIAAEEWALSYNADKALYNATEPAIEVGYSLPSAFFADIDRYDKFIDALSFLGNNNIGQGMQHVIDEWQQK